MQRTSVADGKNTTIRQGYLEDSNVNGIEEMVQMIELSRSFESAQKTMMSQDGTLDKANDMANCKKKWARSRLRSRKCEAGTNSSIKEYL